MPRLVLLAVFYQPITELPLMRSMAVYICVYAKSFNISQLSLWNRCLLGHAGTV